MFGRPRKNSFLLKVASFGNLRVEGNCTLEKDYEIHGWGEVPMTAESAVPSKVTLQYSIWTLPQ